METRIRIKRVIRFSRDREEKRQLICGAIRQRRQIEFYYLGGYRAVEPFALGFVLNNRDKNESLLCWQTAGFSENDLIEGWKLYRVADMEDLEIAGSHFTGDRAGYEPENLEMVEIICCVERVPHVEEIMTPPPEVEPPPPPPPPAAESPRPIVRVISHNQLMERFRCAHPQPIPELDAMLWTEPLARPFPECPLKGSEDFTETVEEEPPPEKNWHGMPVTRPLSYLVGQTA